MSTAQDQQWIDVVGMLVSKFLIPVGVAFIAYIAFDMWGEWRKRRKYSRLGVAIIEALQEEIRNGIKEMSQTRKMVKSNSPNPPSNFLPIKSWNGMSTIPDDVLLRIIETSSNRHFSGFPPKECRIHCKNYFDHMCCNYNEAIKLSNQLAQTGQNWRHPKLQELLDRRGRARYIRSAAGVNRMLKHAKGLLEENSRAWFPK